MFFEIPSTFLSSHTLCYLTSGFQMETNHGSREDLGHELWMISYSVIKCRGKPKIPLSSCCPLGIISLLGGVLESWCWPKFVVLYS